MSAVNHLTDSEFPNVTSGSVISNEFKGKPGDTVSFGTSPDGVGDNISYAVLHSGTGGAYIEAYGAEFPGYPGPGVLALTCGTGSSILLQDGAGTRLATFGPTDVSATVAGIDFRAVNFNMQLQQDGTPEYSGLLNISNGTGTGLFITGVDYPNYPGGEIFVLEAPSTGAIWVAEHGDPAGPYAVFTKAEIKFKERVVLQDNLLSVAFPEDVDEEFKAHIYLATGFDVNSGPRLHLAGKDDGNNVDLIWPGTTGKFEIFKNAGADRIFFVDNNGTNIYAGSLTVNAGDLDMNSNQIINVADATEDDHAVNKGQMDAAIAAAGGSSFTLTAKTDHYTLLTADAGVMFTMDSSSNKDFTVNGSLNLAVGEQIHFLRLGAGEVAIVASGATVNSAGGLKLRARYSTATLLCVATDTYVLIGDLKV